MKRALIVIAAVASAAGCDTSACRGVDGTCVALTVEGAGSVDGLEIALSGAATGTKVAPQMASVAALPVEVGLQLGNVSSGMLHIDVLGVLLGDRVGTGSTDVTITSGAHVHATVTLSGGGGGGSGGGDGGTPIFFDVTGTRVVHYVLGDGGVVDVPEDFTGEAISASVVSDGGIRSVAGSGDANGNFTIHNVPSAPFYLRYYDTFVLGSATSFDLGEWRQGRPDQTAPTSPTTIGLSVTQMAAWDATDTLQLFSMNAGTAIFGLESISAPGNASTTYSASIDLSKVAFGNLIVQAKGDDAFLAQLVGDSNNSVPYQRLAKLGSFAPFTTTNGTNVFVNVAMTDVAQTGSQPIVWTRSQFAQYRTAVHPQATADGDIFDLFAQPGGAMHGYYASTPDVLVVQPAAGTSDVSLTATYGNPYPASWPLVAAVGSSFAVSYAAAGATSKSFDGSIYAYVPLASLPSPVVPVVSPVQSPTIDGQDAFAGVPTASATPVIAWTAPAVGTPSSYTVGVYAIDNVAGKTSLDYLLTMYTKDTSVTIPPGMLAGGQGYFFVITALVDAIDRTVKPYWQAEPTAWADALSGSINVGLVAQGASCKEIHAAHPSYPDGIYTIDVDGAGAAPAVPVYCDMTSDGGGWTLCAWSQDGSKATGNWASPSAAKSSNWYACQKYSTSPVEARVRVVGTTKYYANQFVNVDFRSSAPSAAYNAMPSAAPNLYINLLPNESACNGASTGNLQWSVSTKSSIFGLTPKDDCSTNKPTIFIGSSGVNSNGCWGSGQVPPFIGYPCGGYGNFGIHLELWAR